MSVFKRIAKSRGYEIAELTEEKNAVSRELAKTTIDLKYLEQKYQIIYDTSPDMYRTIDTNGIILDCNISYEKNLGWSKKEIIGRSILDHVADDSFDLMTDSFETWKKFGNVKNKEVRLKRKDGTTFPALLSASSLYDIQGKVIGSNTIIRDMTEIYDEKKRKEEQERTNFELEQMKKMDTLKSEFASMVTHELKTPLFPIKGYCEMLKDPTFGTLTADQLDFVNETLYCANRLERIIKQVLTAQKIDMNQLRFNIDPLDVRQFMDQVFRTNLSIMSSKQIKFVNNTTLDLTVETDSARLEEVFMNLIQNSVDFVDNSGKIEIGVFDSTEYLTFYVKDNGIGIPKDKQNNLFKKFYQIDTSHRRNHGGSGLGLSICKGIIVGLGGKIWLESDLNKGTTFYFSIPKTMTANKNSH